MTDLDSPASGPSGSDRRSLLRLGAGAAGVVGAGALALGSASPAAAAISSGTFFSVTPERLLDTRSDGGGGPIRDGQIRTSTVLAGNQYVCVCNLTVYNTTGKRGFLSLFSAGLTTRPAPFVSISWQGKGVVLTNTVFFQTATAGFKISCQGGSADYTLDFVGYFTGTASRSAEQRAFERRAREAADQLA